MRLWDTGKIGSIIVSTAYAGMGKKEKSNLKCEFK